MMIRQSYQKDIKWQPLPPLARSTDASYGFRKIHTQIYPINYNITCLLAVEIMDRRVFSNFTTFTIALIINYRNCI